MDSSVIVGSPTTPSEKTRRSPLPGTTPAEMEEGASGQKPQDVLKGVVAYVEVRTGHDNRSRGIIKELTQLGARIEPKFNQDVTHVVFKDGKKSTLDKAKKKGVHLVSVLWVDSCKRSQTHVDESLHGPAIPESMSTPILVGRMLKKSKSMQPKDFDEEVASSAERGKNRRRRQANLDRWKTLESPYSPHLPRVVYAAETQPRSPDSLDISYLPNIIIPETPPSMRRKLQELRQKQAHSSEKEDGTPLSTEILTPLQRRLFDPSTSGVFSGTYSPPPSTTTRKPSVTHTDTDSSDNASSDTNKKKNKLFNLETGVLPPEDLIQPTKCTNRKQTKPTFLTPTVDKPKGTGAQKRGRNSRDGKRPNSPEGGYTSEEKSDGKPVKKRRRAQSKSPGDDSGALNKSKAVSDTLMKVKKTNRRQSVATSTPSKTETETSLIKRRGRRSMAVVIPTATVNAADKKQTKKSTKIAETVSKPPVESSPGELEKSTENGTIPKNKNNVNRCSVILENEEVSNDIINAIVASTPADSTSVTDSSMVADSMDSNPVVKRRGRRSTILKKSHKELPISPLVSADNVFNETTDQNTIIQRKSTQNSELNNTDTSDISVPTEAKVNRRRSVRIQNSSLLSFTQELNQQPLITPGSRKPRKSVIKSTPASEYGSQGKCPADFDSTADDSVLALLPKKKTFKSVASAVKRKSDSDDNSDGKNKKQTKKKAPVKNLDGGCLAHSRKSLEDFHPSQFVKKKPKQDSKGVDSLDSSASGSGDSECKIKRKVKSSNSRASRCSSSSSDESVSHTSSDRPKFSMVTTSMHFDEQDVVRSIIQSLKGYRLTTSVKDNTTHVICGDARRTLNVLYAISRGCWLLSKNWILESLEKGEWVDEEAFELHDYFPAAQASRRERLKCKPNEYCSDIFADAGNIFVADQTSPPHHHLVALIKLNGGKVTQCTRKADIFIGSGSPKERTSLLEAWVLDSITCHRCQPFDKYHQEDQDRSERATSPVF